MAKPETPEHLEAAEKAAKALAGKAPRHADVLRVFRLIKAADWPTQTRPNVAPNASSPEVTGMVLGLSPNRQGGCSIAQGSKQCPHLTKLVTSWVRATLPDDKRRPGREPNCMLPSRCLAGRGDAAGGAAWILRGLARIGRLSPAHRFR